MIIIDSLKDYINKPEFNELTKQIYDITKSLINEYPNYKEWYFNKQLPRIIANKGDILFAKSDDKPTEIIGIACLKKDDSEQKISTLYVIEQERGKQIGSKLLEASSKYLETSKPLITFFDYKLEMFQPIIDKYDWQLTSVVEDLNKNNTKELYFNENK